MTRPIWPYVCGYVPTFFAHSAFALSSQLQLSHLPFLRQLKSNTDRFKQLSFQYYMTLISLSLLFYFGFLRLEAAVQVLSAP